MTQPTVAFVTANTFDFDSRHRRAAEALAGDGWSVVVVAMAGSGLPAEESWDSGVVVRRPEVDRRILGAVPAPLRAAVARLLSLPRDAERLPSPGRGATERLRGVLRRGLEIAAFARRVRPWATAAVAAAPEARIWVAKALVAVPVAAAAARRTGGRYVYDIADLHVDSGRLAAMPVALKAWFRRREARLVRGAVALLAATPALSAEVARRYEVAPPTVVMNARERWRPDDPGPCPPILRETAGLEPDREVLLYQGAFRQDQGIDTLLAALDEPALRDRPLSAIFLGFGALEDRLRRLAVERPGRVVVLPPVPSGDLLEWTAGADVAFVGTPPTTVNQMLTTPNKLFEAVMAGVPVVVAAGTWTASLVGDEDLGVVVDPWTAGALAAAVATVLDAPAAAREQRRRAIRAAALDRLNWDVERERLLRVFRSLR
jgi:glycosyltransferase involved in cell wall biosynthesis